MSDRARKMLGRFKHWFDDNNPDVDRRGRNGNNIRTQRRKVKRSEQRFVAREMRDESE